MNGLPLSTQLLVGVVGPAVGAAIALLGVWLNTRTTAASAAAARAADHTNQLREVVARILAERPHVLGSQQTLFTTAYAHFRLERTGDGPKSEELYADRDRHFLRCNTLEQLSIRASLLTSNPKIIAALHTLRAIAEEPLRPMNAAGEDPDDAATAVEAFRHLRSALAGAFDELESSTRQVTAIDVAH